MMLLHDALMLLTIDKRALGGQVHFFLWSVCD
jgi:hypothetical protein